MNYQLTCLTPVLIGDGSHLSPIDYMVWKDQVNVLDQARIFRLLAKGPRLENYLREIKRAEKLDFASWGGFAQNFAGRRIAFEHPSSAKYWEQLESEYLRIPTFTDSSNGPFVPGAAIKGAIRTGLLGARVSSNALKDISARLSGERPPRWPGQLLEDRSLGSSGACHLKPFIVSDSVPVAQESLRIYALRTATLAPKGPSLELRWQRAPRGSVERDRPGAGTPVFAEMAAPGTVFSGRWKENRFFSQPEVAKDLRWKEPLDTTRLMDSVNESAERTLKIHRRYTEVAGLEELGESVASLLARLVELRERKNGCLLSIGWGAGFLSKSAAGNPLDEAHREILARLSYYAKAIHSGLPFPKTRRVVFLEDRPAALPGWAELRIS